MKSTLLVISLIGLTVTASGTWRVGPGHVRVICPMTIGGTFDATTTALSGALTADGNDPAALNGTLTVDLRTLDTGINLRNEHLREHYLEVTNGPEFDRATLSEIHVKGVDPDVGEGKGSFTGLLRLHGVTKTVTGTIDVRPAGAGVDVKASFPVTLADYSIRKPRYLGVGVKDTVTIEVAVAVTR
jgi:polyisoprenoid-binding protein YceI